MLARQAALLLIIAATAGCGDDDTPAAATSTASAATTATASSTAAASASASSSAEPAVPPPTAQQLAAWKACAADIEQTKTKPALPGAPGFERSRVHLARVRGRPMLWRREPAPVPKLVKLREVNKKSSVHVVRAVRNLIRKTKSHEMRRKVLLREGYLWSDDVWLALALVEQVSLTKLFGEKTVYLERGVDILELQRVKRSRFKREHYKYLDGLYAGEKAEVLLGDRVATKREDLTEPLQIDLHDIMRRYAFDRIRPVQLTADELLAEVRYGPKVWVPALFKLAGARADLSCEALTAELVVAKTKFVDDRELLRDAMKHMHSVVRAMVRAEIPFDADPNQSNGFLRKAWTRAYFKGWRRFTYEGKTRDVYAKDGQPKPPQVCIDFLTDAWERASGTWYAPAVGDPLKPQPKRTRGPIDFDKLDVKNRRSVSDFTKFAQKRHDVFDVWTIPKNKRIAFKNRDAFYNYLHEQADMFRPGDMLTIHGYKEGGRPHYHSLILLEQDPITGVPILVAGNAVFPREQTLEGVMHISPKRSLRHRIRVREPWLRFVRDQGAKKL